MRIGLEATSCQRSAVNVAHVPVLALRSQRAKVLVQVCPTCKYAVPRAIVPASPSVPLFSVSVPSPAPVAQWAAMDPASVPATL